MYTICASLRSVSRNYPPIRLGLCISIFINFKTIINLNGLFMQKDKCIL